MATFLADTSIWAWSNKGTRTDIRAKLAQRFARDEVVTCTPVVLETLHRARDGAEYEQLLNTLFTPLRWLPLTNDVSERALGVQRELAQVTHGNDLRPAVDFLIAAIGEMAGPDVILWFFDRDLAVICDHTGQPQEAEVSIGPEPRVRPSSASRPARP